jgi:hypothetical protein
MYLLEAHPAALGRTLEKQDLHRLHLDGQARQQRVVAHARVVEPSTTLHSRIEEQPSEGAVHTVGEYLR